MGNGVIVGTAVEVGALVVGCGEGTGVGTGEGNGVGVRVGKGDGT